jgi:membrane-bound lytic murein transglycosylase B
MSPANDSPRPPENDTPVERRHPAHATVWPRMPQLSTSSWRAIGVVALLALALATLAGAGSTTRRVAALPEPGPVATQIATPQPRAWIDAQAVPPPVSTITSKPPPATTAPGRPTFPPAALAPVLSTVTADGIPSVALDAYRRAAARETIRAPGCHIPWPLLAGIGRIESDHGQYGGAALHADGQSTPRIIGIALTGNGTARITDTDRGRLDGDTTFDRAVGPMQFIPSTWAGWGVDGNGDGIADPFNIYDAAAAAADYVCAAGGDLRTSAGQQRAIMAYNASTSYLSIVLSYEAAYAAGLPGVTIPVFGPPPSATSTLPPVNPGPPAALPHTSATPSRHPTTAPATRSTTPRPAATTAASANAPSSTSPTTTAESPSPTTTTPSATTTSPSATTTATSSTSTATSPTATATTTPPTCPTDSPSTSSSPTSSLTATSTATPTCPTDSPSPSATPPPPSPSS